MMKYGVYFLLFGFLWACTDDTTLPKPEVFQIKEIGELSTTEYIFSKVLRVDDPGEWYKFGNRKILISCKAKVKAGINLKAIQKNDIVVNGDEVSIRLPRPKITSFNMDPNSVRTEVVDVDGFRDDFNQEDINHILQMGEKSIRAALNETGIYAEAEKNAIAFVQEFYKQLGYAKVTVEIKENNEK